MGDSTMSGKPNNGRIVILHCRLSTYNKRSFRIKYIRRFDTKQPVYAIAKLDERWLLVSCY